MEPPPSIMAIPAYQDLKPKPEVKTFEKQHIMKKQRVEEPEIYEAEDDNYEEQRQERLEPPEWRSEKKSMKLEMFENADISHI